MRIDIINVGSFSNAPERRERSRSLAPSLADRISEEKKDSLRMSQSDESPNVKRQPRSLCDRVAARAQPQQTRRANLVLANRIDAVPTERARPAADWHYLIVVRIRAEERTLETRVA